jgi:hypothetical protein
VKSVVIYKLLPVVVLAVGLAEVPLKPSLSEKNGVEERSSPSPSPMRQPAPTANPQKAQYAYPSFNSKQFDQQLELYLNYLETVGVPDVLIVGSSRALQGVDPIVLQQGLAKRGFPNRRVFNFGINGATAQVVDLLLRRILTPDQLPRLILWADGSRAFNNGRVDITYNGMVASQGYKMLAKGVRPALPRQPQPDEICIQVSPEYFAVQGGVKATKASVELLCGSLSKFSNQLLPLYPLLPKLTPQKPINNGFRQATERFNPDNYYRRYPRVAGLYDADYQNFNLQGKQTIALQNVVKFAQSHKISIVLINLPLTQSYLDATRTEYERQFHQHMQQLAKQKQFIFRNLNQQRQLARNEYFTDPSHINRFGAAAIAAHLAKDPAIPWKILK